MLSSSISVANERVWLMSIIEFNYCEIFSVVFLKIVWYKKTTGITEIPIVPSERITLKMIEITDVSEVMLEKSIDISNRIINNNTCMVIMVPIVIPIFCFTIVNTRVIVSRNVPLCISLSYT